MKKRWIEYHDSWQHSPMTYWVYRAADDSRWHEAKEYNPPAPPPFRAKGFPLFCVELDGVPFRFASLRELRVCIEVLSRKILPTSAQLIREHGLTGFSNHVWLGRLPKKTHSLRYREKALPYLLRSLAEFEKEVPNQPPEPKPPAAQSPKARPN